MADTNIQSTKYSPQSILNQAAVDTDDGGKPTAIAICNPDGSNVGIGTHYFDTPEQEGTYSAKQVGSDLVFYRFESGVDVEKFKITA